jgi:hypothetical protein
MNMLVMVINMVHAVLPVFHMFTFFFAHENPLKTITKKSYFFFYLLDR